LNTTTTRYLFAIIRLLGKNFNLIFKQFILILVGLKKKTRIQMSLKRRQKKRGAILEFSSHGDVLIRAAAAVGTAA
jgi:hypothetical protein